MKVGTNGAILFQDVTADNTEKLMRLGSRHYDIDEEPFYSIISSSQNGKNLLYIGGATSQGNAATTISVYAAADSTTTGGTEVEATSVTLKEIKVDTVFSGSGTGLPYGNIYTVGSSIVMSTSYVKLLFATAGELNLVTASKTGDDYTDLKITKAGRYLISLTGVAAAGTAADVLVFKIAKNAGVTSIRQFGQIRVETDSDYYTTFSATCISNLAVNDTIEAWAYVVNDAAVSILYQVDLTVSMVGG